SPPPRPRARAACSRPSGSRSTPDAVDGAAGGLPRVVRGARAERGLVRDDARVAADGLRAACMPEEVRVVALLPDEDQVRSGHVLGDKRAPVGRAREGVRRDAVPPGVVLVGVVGPELLVLEQLLLVEDGAAWFPGFHAPKGTRMGEEA